jgi:hypothetical protein
MNLVDKALLRGCKQTLGTLFLQTDDKYLHHLHFIWEKKIKVDSFIPSAWKAALKKAGFFCQAKPEQASNYIHLCI